MLSPEQINEVHRLHLVEKWPQRRIARHLHIGRHTLAKYLDNPAPPPAVAIGPASSILSSRP